MSYCLGYQQLGKEVNGENLQKAYKRLEEEAWKVYYSDEDIYEGQVDVTDLSLGADETNKLIKFFDEDASIFYFLYGVQGLSVTSEDEGILKYHIQTFPDDKTGEDMVDYTIGSKRSEIRAVIETKLHEYWDLTKDITVPQEKERIIAKKIMAEVVYDHEKSDIAYNHNILGVFRNGITVCEGYARAMQVVCNYCNVDCIYVLGMALNEGHAWNKVLLGSEWYDVDITWQDNWETDEERIEKSYGTSPYPWCEDETNMFPYLNMPHNYFESKHEEEQHRGIQYPESSANDTYWDVYIINDPRNGSSDEEQIQNGSRYVKEKILEGNKTIGLLYKGIYKFYNIEKIFEAAISEIEKETGKVYEITPGYIKGSNSINSSSDISETVNAMYIPISEKKTVNNMTYYVNNIPKQGVYLSKDANENKIRSYLPDEIDGKAVTVVENPNSIEQLVLPSNCYCIIGADWAKQLIVPESLREIYGRYSKLKAIYLPNSIKYIENNSLGYTNSLSDKNEKFVIYGYAGSLAEEYAKNNGFVFVDVTGLNLVNDVQISELMILSDTDIGAISNNVKIANAKIENISCNTEEDAFQEGKQYELEITLKAEDGKAFTPNTLVDINGEAVNISLNGTNEAVVKWIGQAETKEQECAHTYDEGIITKKATCKEEGTRVYTCNKCGNTYKEVIPAKEHVAVTDKAVAATCTEAGKTEGSHCSVCGTVFKAQEPIPAKGHTYKTTKTPADVAKKKNGSIIKKCTVCGEMVSKKVIYYPKTITLSKTKYTYNGKVQKPSVTVKDSKGNVIKSSNYTVSYSKGCKSVGKYTVAVKFKGNYSGTVKKTFTIIPKGTSLTGVSAKSRGFTAKWKKQSSQITGYQIQYSTSSKFTGKDVKTTSIKKNSSVSKSITKLKAKKKYYVRVRTYKAVKISGKNTNFYSGWSKAKSVTTKK